MDNKIFISYSSEDAKVANKIVSFIEDKGFNCWIAPRNIEPGHDYTDSINSAIRNCSCVVLVFSERAVLSQWVKKEIGLAVHFKKCIIPYKISNFQVDDGYFFLLNNVQWIDAAGQVEGKKHELISGIEAALHQSANTHPTEEREPRYSNNKKKIFIVLSSVILVIIVAIILVLSRVNNNTEDNNSMDTVTASVMPEQDSVLDIADNNAPSTQRPTKKNTDIKSTGIINTEPSGGNDQVSITSDSFDDKPDEVPVQEGPSEYDLKLRNAKLLYSNGQYEGALHLFQELKNEYPNGSSLDYYISECKRKRDEK